MPSDTYRPIDCAQYDVFEIAIMRGQCLNMRWQARDDVVHVEVIKPTGLQTRKGEEFLLFVRASGQADEVRLDRIISTK